MDVGSNTFLVLPSNSREENKSSDFTTLLPYQLSLRGGQWEAGITEIICNSHFDNVSEPLNFSIDYYDGESQEFILPAGTYTSGQILISSIQSLVNGTRPNPERKLSRKSKALLFDPTTRSYTEFGDSLFDPITKLPAPKRRRRQVIFDPVTKTPVDSEEKNQLFDPSTKQLVTIPSSDSSTENKKESVAPGPSKRIEKPSQIEESNQEKKLDVSKDAKEGIKPVATVPDSLPESSPVKTVDKLNSTSKETPTINTAGPPLISSVSHPAEKKEEPTVTRDRKPSEQAKTEGKEEKKTPPQDKKSAATEETTSAQLFHPETKLEIKNEDASVGKGSGKQGQVSNPKTTAPSPTVPSPAATVGKGAPEKKGPAEETETVKATEIPIGGLFDPQTKKQVPGSTTKLIPAPTATHTSLKPNLFDPETKKQVPEPTTKPIPAQATVPSPLKPVVFDPVTKNQVPGSTTKLTPIPTTTPRPLEPNLFDPETRYTVESGPPIVLSFDENLGRVTLSIRHRNVKRVRFHPDLCYMLGFGECEITQETRANWRLDLRNSHTCMFIYCSIIENQIVGSNTASLLRIVPLPENSTGAHSSTFFPIQYCRLRTNLLSSVRIMITDEANRPIRFSGGPTIVTLHLRRCQS